MNLQKRQQNANMPPMRCGFLYKDQLRIKSIKRVRIWLQGFRNVNVIVFTLDDPILSENSPTWHKMAF